MVSIPLKILYANIVIVLPILLAYCLFSPTTIKTHDASKFQIADITVSGVLAQCLQSARTTREHGILTLALLELQNPELTVFAGAGYGVHLRNPNPGAAIEAFPNGKLPQAGGSRYDPWTRVKGLRYAAGMIVTNGSAGPDLSIDSSDGRDTQSRIQERIGGVGQKKGKADRGGWLVYQQGDKSAVDAAGFGWATLLLERAGAIDIDNPVGQGRNVYGEAADGMLEWFYDETKNVGYLIGAREDKDLDDTDLGRERDAQPNQWAISYTFDTPQLRPETIFLAVPFLAAYAVARYDNYWLLEAIEQIRMHKEILPHAFACQRADLTQNEEGPLKSKTDPFDGEWRPLDIAWVLAGIVRVLAVTEKWQREIPEEIAVELAQGRRDLVEFTEQILYKLWSIPTRNHTSLLADRSIQNSAVSSSEDTVTQVTEVGGAAFVASSVYRLAQLGLINDQVFLSCADKLYNHVATHITIEEKLATTLDHAESLSTNTNKLGQSESQSMVLMMYAARRDCVKLNICRRNYVESWKIWPLSWFM